MICNVAQSLREDMVKYLRIADSIRHREAESEEWRKVAVALDQARKQHMGSCPKCMAPGESKNA